jgi:hypothetical protein
LGSRPRNVLISDRPTIAERGFGARKSPSFAIAGGAAVADRLLELLARR